MSVKADIAADRAFVAGLKLGYNLGVGEERDRMNAIVIQIWAEIAEARCTASPPPQPEAER